MHLKREVIWLEQLKVLVPGLVLRSKVMMKEVMVSRTGELKVRVVWCPTRIMQGRLGRQFQLCRGGVRSYSGVWKDDRLILQQPLPM